MTKKASGLLSCAVVAALSLSSAVGFAAMPAGASIGASHDGVVIAVQDKSAASEKSAAPAKKKKMTRKQEAEQSAKDGTVPSRYRSQIPKEYHQYIPFAKQ